MRDASPWIIGPAIPPALRLYETPLPVLLANAAAAWPDSIAIDDGLSRLTYAELWAASLCMADAVARTAPPGRPVAIVLPNRAIYPAAWIGCLLAGRPAALLHANDPQERNRLCLEETGAGALIGETNPTDLLFIPIAAASGPAPSSPPVVPHPSADQPSFIVFTSGSTGRPKAVAIGAEALVFRAGTLINTVAMAPDDAVLSLVPPNAIGGILNLLETFLAGATLLRLDLPRVPLSRHAGKRVTQLYATPALLRVIAQMDEDQDIRRGLRLIQPIGDAMLRAELAQLRATLPPGCAILNAYGSTEALVSLQWFIPDPYEHPGARLAAGTLVPGYDCRIAEANGEFLVRSRFTSLGTWHQGALRRFPEIHHTGDVAARAADGLVTILGRLDRQVKIFGNRVELAEIEQVLRSQPGVAEAVVVATAGLDPTLHAFVVPAHPAEAGLAASLAATLAAALPAAMQPKKIVLISRLPLLPSGKIDAATLLRHDI